MKGINNMRHGNRNGDQANAAGGTSKFLGIPGAALIVLAFFAWVVALAGVAVLRKQGGENVLGQELSFTWWVIFFELFVLLAAGIHLTGARLNRLDVIGTGAAGISGILAVVTALTMLETQRWNSARKVTSRSDRIGKGAITAFAGFLALSALNTLLILILGSHQTHSVHHWVERNPAYPAAVAPGTNGGTHSTTAVPTAAGGNGLAHTQTVV
jgi:hypothetical protein